MCACHSFPQLASHVLVLPSGLDNYSITLSENTENWENVEDGCLPHWTDFISKEHCERRILPIQAASCQMKQRHRDDFLLSVWLQDEERACWRVLYVVQYNQLTSWYRKNMQKKACIPIQTALWGMYSIKHMQYRKQGIVIRFLCRTVIKLQAI